MKSKNIIKEAIDTVLAASNEFAWIKIVKGIVNGKYFVDDWYSTSDKEIELYCDSQEEDEITEEKLQLTYYDLKQKEKNIKELKKEFRRKKELPK